MRELCRMADLDRGYKVVLIHTHKAEDINDLDLYDVEVQDKTGGTVIVASSRCTGEKSGHFWMDRVIQFMDRLLLLVDARDTACYNLGCYSKDFGMSIPKEGYADEWHKELNKVKMIQKWLVDHSEYYGKGDDRTNLIRLEFDIDEIYAK